MTDIKELLDQEVCNRNNNCELSYEKPDPLLVASRYNDEYIILLCALFAYGKASMIVKFLDTLDCSLLNASDEKIDKELDSLFKKINPIIQNYMNKNSIEVLLDRKNIFIGSINSDLTKILIDEINKATN